MNARRIAIAISASMSARMDARVTLGRVDWDTIPPQPRRDLVTGLAALSPERQGSPRSPSRATNGST